MMLFDYIFSRLHYLAISAPAMSIPKPQPTPGPGAYEVTSYKEPVKQAAASANFLSTLPRGTSLLPYHDASPGPGVYIRTLLLYQCFSTFLLEWNPMETFHWLKEPLCNNLVVLYKKTYHNTSNNLIIFSAAYKPTYRNKSSFIYNFKGRWI